MDPIVENGKELVGQSLEKAALMELNRIEAGIADLKEKYSGLVADVRTAEGMDTLSKARAAIRAVRYQVPKVVESTTKRLNNLKKSIQTEGERIEKELHLIEDPIHAQIKAEDDRKAAEKEAEKQKEEERRGVILDRINAIAAIPATAINLSTIELQDLIKSTVALPITGADFAEFLSKAESVRVNTLDQLRSILFKVAENERVAAELEAQRIQMEKDRAEREEKESAERERVRLEQEAVAARLEAESQRLRAEKAEQDRLAAEKEAERQKSLETEQAKMAAERAEMEAANLKRQQEEAEAAEKFRKEREAFEAEKAEAKAKIDADNAERERLQREAEDKAAAEAAEAARIQAEKEAQEKAEAEEKERLARVAEAAKLRAEFDEKVKDINFAMGYIYQLCQTPNLDPLEAVQKIREISGKFMDQEAKPAIKKAAKR